MARLKKMFVISDEDYKYLKKIKEENKLQYISDSLKFIIDKSRNNESEPIKNIDKNVKTLIEMMNELINKNINLEMKNQSIQDTELKLSKFNRRKILGIESNKK